MWDIDGKLCCYRGPFFVEHELGPCPNVVSCPYSHKQPIHTIRPQVVKAFIREDRIMEPLVIHEEDESTSDFLFGRLPRQIEAARLKAARAELDAMWEETHPSLDMDSIMK